MVSIKVWIIICCVFLCCKLKLIEVSLWLFNRNFHSLNALAAWRFGPASAKCRFDTVEFGQVGWSWVGWLRSIVRPFSFPPLPFHSYPFYTPPSPFVLPITPPSPSPPLKRGVVLGLLCKMFKIPNTWWLGCTPLLRDGPGSSTGQSSSTQASTRKGRT